MKNATHVLKVLADETRLRILWLLFNHKELCVCDFMAALEITQSKASRHLGILRHAGFVADRKDGLWSHYSLRPVDDDFVQRCFDMLRGALAESKDADSLLAALHARLNSDREGAACSEDTAQRSGAKRRKTATATGKR